MSTTCAPKRRRRRFPAPKPPFLGEKRNTYVYIVTKFDEEGWADAQKYKPIPYDLVCLMKEDGKEKNGWWAEFFWDGYRIKSTDKIVKWKKSLLWSLGL